MFTTIFPFPPMAFCSFPSLHPFTISCQSLKALSLFAVIQLSPACCYSAQHTFTSAKMKIVFYHSSHSRRNLNLMHYFRNLHRCLALGKSLLRKHFNRQTASLIQILPAGVEALNITSVDNKTLSLSYLSFLLFY